MGNWLELKKEILKGLGKGKTCDLVEEVRKTRFNPSQKPSLKKGNQGSKRVYDYATYLMLVNMYNSEYENYRLLKSLKKDDIIIIRGKYDRAEEVLDSGGLPFTRTGDKILSSLSPKQILILNCPGEISRGRKKDLEDFVESGGYLISTDWAIEIVEEAFPGFIKYNDTLTEKDMVKIEIPDPQNEYVKGLFPKEKPVWWLESKSYPFETINPKVKILVKSEELYNRYKASPVGVVFDYGKGKVFHFISHFYLQKFKASRLSIHTLANKLKITTENEILKETKDIPFEKALSAYSSARILYNIILDKLKKNGK